MTLSEYMTEVTAMTGRATARGTMPKPGSVREGNYSLWLAKGLKFAAEGKADWARQMLGRCKDIVVDY